MQAGPPGAAYRIRKFVQRHRLGVSILSWALALKRKIWGDRRPNTGFGLTNLARVLHQQKHFAAAEPLYRVALELGRAVLPAGHPDARVGGALTRGASRSTREAEAQGD